MSQNTIKKALAYAAAIVAALIGASSTLGIPDHVIKWIAFAGVVLGIFGASPIGRVIGDKETRTVGPKFPPPDDEDDRATPRSRPVVTR